MYIAKISPMTKFTMPPKTPEIIENVEVSTPPTPLVAKFAIFVTMLFQSIEPFARKSSMRSPTMGMLISDSSR